MIVFLPSQIHGLSKEKPNVFYPIKMRQNCPELNFPSARSFCYAIIPCLQSHNFTFLFKQELKKKTLQFINQINISVFPVCLFFPAVRRTLSLYNYTGSSYSWFLGSFSQWNLPKLQLTQEIALFPSMLSNFSEVTFITILGLPAKLHKVLRVRKDNITPVSLPIPDKG